MKSAMQKHSGFTPMLKNVFRRNVLSLVLTQLFTLFIILIIAVDMLSKKPLKVENITLIYGSDLSSYINLLLFTVSLIVVYILYRELYSRRASDFLLSMPVKREAFFNANALFCLISAYTNVYSSARGWKERPRRNHWTCSLLRASDV